MQVLFYFFLIIYYIYNTFLPGIYYMNINHYFIKSILKMHFFVIFKEKVLFLAKYNVLTRVLSLRVCIHACENNKI